MQNQQISIHLWIRFFPVRASARCAASNSLPAFVYSHMPPEVQIIFAGGEVGHRCFSGGAMSDCQPVDNPCRAAYIKYEGGTHKNRHDADPVTTLMAIAGPGAVSCSECTGCDGVIDVSNATGGNRWIAGAPSNQSYLVLNGNKTKSAIDAGAAIDALLCKPRKVKTDDGANRRSALLFFDDSALQEHNLTRVAFEGARQIVRLR